MGDRYTRSAELLAKLAGAAPESKYIRAFHGSPNADEPFEFIQLTEEQIRKLLANDPWAKKPKQTMDRFEPVLQKRGVENIGTIKDVEASLIGMPPDAAGPGGLEPHFWTRMLRGFPKSPDSTPMYVTNPVEAVASQYPLELRQQAIDNARQFQMSDARINSGVEPRLFQSALSLEDPRAVLLAYPRRRVVEPGAAGLAHFGAVRNRPGLAEVAAGRGNSPDFFDRVMLHELRHTLEGDGLNAKYRYGGYQDWKMPKSLAIGPAKKDYLSQTGEEVARFGDGRARYAQLTNSLIADEAEAEKAASYILENRFGLGEGFYAPERAFYKAAREADPAIRAHQNRLLQGLLAVPPAVMATMQDE